MLSGVFYIHAAVLCLTGLVMAWLQQQTMVPNIGITIFGVVSCAVLLSAGLEILPTGSQESQIGQTEVRTQRAFSCTATWRLSRPENPWSCFNVRR